MNINVDYIPLDQCKDRFLYQINSRNLSYGVYNEENKGFVGIRNKFGEDYLFTEYHYNNGMPHGTVFPKKELTKIPDDLSIKVQLGTIDEKSKRPVQFDYFKTISEGGKGWFYTDTGESDKNIRPLAIENDKLFEYLKTFMERTSRAENE
jgi:hypothetical protein